jgi:cell wall-active antibiotic response 4TMS protein YvqF
MSKKVFWPVTLVLMGLIFLAYNLGLLSQQYWSFWPIILIIVGLGGLVTSDREEWMCCSQPKTSKKAKKTKKTSKMAKKRK